MICIHHSIFISKYFDFKNEQIDSFLSQRGFFVSHNAHSLYDATYSSLSSTLNLAPLDYYDDPAIPDYKKTLISLKRLEEPVVMKALQEAGYQFHNYSVFKIGGQSSPLSFNLEYHLDQILTSTTFFNRLYNEFEPDFLLASKNYDLRFLKKGWSELVEEDLAKLNEAFQRNLSSVTSNKKPGFYYYHFMVPHPPAVYDSNGNKNAVSEMYAFGGLDASKVKFIGYTQYGNQLIRNMVNAIFNQLGENVIIIIQGDHGYREFSDELPQEARYGIFNSIYLPKKNYSSFNDSIQPIETWKLVLSGGLVK